MEQIARLDDHLTNVRARLLKGGGQTDEMIALFDGLTSCLATIAAEVAMLRQDLKDRADA